MTEQNGAVPATPGDPESIATLIGALSRWARRLIPDPDRAERLADELSSATWAEDDEIASDITRENLRRVEAICHRTARHLTLQLREPAEPDSEVVGWPAVAKEATQRRAGFVRKVERLADGYGLLRIDGLDDITFAAEYLRAAFTVLRGTRGLVLDLRRNGGGSPATLALVAEFVLGSGIEHLSTVRYRDLPDRQWWTSGILGECRLAADVRVAVLIGSGTYSSGEALSYHLRTRNRVRLFGQRTPGAADHVTPVRVTRSVEALIPEATPIDAVTGTNWEGTGVVPDVNCPSNRTKKAALSWLRGRARQD